MVIRRAYGRSLRARMLAQTAGKCRFNRNFTAHCDLGAELSGAASPSPRTLPPAQPKPCSSRFDQPTGTAGCGARAGKHCHADPGRQGTAMSASDESHTQQDAARRRDAIADMQERLTQFSRTVGRARDGLPEQHADALSRIEQEIGSLGERIAAFSPEGQSRERADASSAPAAPPEADNPWDPQSAEVLMQAYESAEAQFTAAGPEAESHRRRQWPREVEAAGAAGAPSLRSAVARGTLCRHRRAAAARSGGHQFWQRARCPRSAPRPVRATPRLAPSAIWRWGRTARV